MLVLAVVVAVADAELANVELSSVPAFSLLSAMPRSPRHKVTAAAAALRMTDGGLHRGAVADDERQAIFCLIQATVP